MKKLEDIPKKEIFKVPDGYFDSLPNRIQARIAEESPAREERFFFRFKLQYALPVIVLLAVGAALFLPVRQPDSVESLLAGVQTEELIAYLEESGITTEDVLEDVEFNATDLDEIEAEVYELTIGDEDLLELMEDEDL
jgi:hypothetical protein